MIWCDQNTSIIGKISVISLVENLKIQDAEIPALEDIIRVMDSIKSNDINLLSVGISDLLYSVFPINRCLYILGSGASARHSKMESSLAKTIVEDYWSGGSFGIDDQSEDSLAIRLLWLHMESHEDAFFQELSRKIPDSFIKARVNEEYAQLKYTNDNPEYKVFLLAKRFSTIIDTNYEGFSAYYLRNYHHVIPLHGVANVKLAQFTKQIRDDILMWGVDLSKHTDIKVYPGEKQSGNFIGAYKNHLADIFSRMEWIIIIGYTFANMGSYLNDAPLFEFIKERVEHYKKIKIMIINPSPEPVAALFHKEMDRTTILPAYWDHLTRAISLNCFVLHREKTASMLRDYFRFLPE